MVLTHTYAGKVSLDFLTPRKSFIWGEEGQESQEHEGMVTGY